MALKFDKVTLEDNKICQYDKLFLSLVKSVRYSGSSGAYECRLISFSKSIFARIILFKKYSVFLIKALNFYVTIISHSIIIYLIQKFSIINIFFFNIMNSPEGSKTGTVQTHQTDALYKCIVKNNIQMHAFMARSIMMMHIGNQIRC